MDEDNNLYSLMSTIVSRDPNLNFDNITNDMNNKTRNHRHVQEQVGSLLNSAHGKQSFPSDVKCQVDSMMMDVTNGNFQNYISTPSIAVDSDVNYETALSHKMEDLKFFNEQIERLKNETKQSQEKREKLQTMEAIQSQLEDIENMKANLDRLMSSLGRLKGILDNIVSNPKLNEDVYRDLLFEENMRKVCEKVNNFNQFIDAKKNIERLCRSSDDVKISHGPKESNDIPVVISSLLRDVSSVLLNDD